MTELEKYTDKLTVQESNSASDSAALLPFVEVLTSFGEKTGLAFHGVPGGHEFTSFILGLYNAAGPGQPLDPAIREKILAIDHRVQMQILVSLSCTMCPDLVVAAQRIASLNPLVTAEVYDIAHFPDLKEKYNIMSVPCLVINQDHVTLKGNSVITGNNCTGGIVGGNNNSVTNCTADVTIESANGGHAIGGLCGYAGTHSNPDVCLEIEGFSTKNYPSVFAPALHS